MDTYMDGEQFRIIRTKILNISKLHLSDIIGISERYVGQLESGERPIKSSMALAMQYLSEYKGVVIDNRYTRHLLEELDEHD